MYPWLFNVYMEAEISGGRGEVETAWPLVCRDLVLCNESEEDLRAKVECFVEMYKRRGIKVNVGKSKAMLLNGKEGLECEARVDEMQLEHVSEFKYLECVLDAWGVAQGMNS